METKQILLIQDVFKSNKILSENCMLSSANIANLLKISEIIIYPKGTQIAGRKESGFLYIVIKGVLSTCFKGKEGLDKIVDFFLEGDIIHFYDMNEYIYVISKSTILKIDLERSIRLICSDTMKLKEAIKEDFLYRIKSELYFSLLPTEEKYKMIIADGNRLLLKVPSKYVASYIGITPQALCRMKRRLCADNN